MAHWMGLVAGVMLSAVAMGAGPQGERVVDLDHPVEFKKKYETREAWGRRARALREQVLVAAGLWPMPPKGNLKPVIHGRIEREGYTVEKVYFESLPGFYVTGNLYRPVGEGPFAGVLSPHGHWPGGRFYREKDPKKEIEIGAERTVEAAEYPLQARCAMLARMGCVVFHYDMVGYADSVQVVHREGFTDVEAQLRLQSVLGLQLWNSIRALDFLESLPGVDAKRIGVTGASGGATQTLLLGVVDDRPAAMFPAVMISENMQGGCVCENAPLLRIGTNNAELAACLAPRPLGMSAANDWTRDLETRGYPQIREIYKLYGAEGKVIAKYFPFEHNYNVHAREMMYDFMNKYLGLGWEGPVREKPFVPVPVEELSVWDDQHPRPTTDGVKIVKEWWTREAARQMEELRGRPAEHRRVVGTALRVMLGRDEEVRVGGGSGGGERVVVRAGGVGGVEMPAAGPAPDGKYAAFTFGYNRTLLAERARRLVEAIEAAREAGAGPVALEARGRYGVAGWVAAEAAGPGVDRAGVEVGDFGFERVREPADENFLPGAVKYGLGRD